MFIKITDANTPRMPRWINVDKILWFVPTGATTGNLTVLFLVEGNRLYSNEVAEDLLDVKGLELS